MTPIKVDAETDHQVRALSDIGHSTMEISRRTGFGIREVEASLARTNITARVGLN